MAKKKRKNDPDLLVPLPPPEPMSPERFARETLLLEALERSSEGASSNGELQFTGKELRSALRQLSDARVDPTPPGELDGAYLRWTSERLQQVFEHENAEIRRLHLRADACLGASLAALLVAFLIQTPGPQAMGAFALQLALFLSAAGTMAMWWQSRALEAPRLPAAVFLTDADHPDRASESSWLARTRRSLQSLAADAGSVREELGRVTRRCQLCAGLGVLALLALPVWSLARLIG